MKVIGVVGYPASGKGEFSRVAGEIGIPVVVMGDMIRRRVDAAGQPRTDAYIGEAARQLRAELGMDAVAILTAQDVDLLNADTVVIDGIRGDAEVRYFRSHFPDFTLVAVRASFATRLARMQSRGRSDDTVTAETLTARDVREDSFGLARAMELADLVIENESDRETYEAEVCACLRGTA